jgi:three-Cys-motif partner protein
MKHQTLIKHDILTVYLKKWLSILGRPKPDERRTLYYVDTHAGRGRYHTGEDGSPIIAMKVGQELAEHYASQGGVRLVTHNVEIDKSNFASLETEVKALQPQCPDVFPNAYFGPVRDHAQSILEHVPTGAAMLVFIDPFGYDVPMSMVLEFLRSRKRAEVFITFMSHFVNRFLGDSGKAAAMNAIYGGEQWRELLNIHVEGVRQDRAVDLYCDCLQSKLETALNVRGIVYPINVAHENASADIYHLIHVSQAFKARQAMEEAVERAKLLRTEVQMLVAPKVEQRILELLRMVQRPVPVADLSRGIWRTSSLRRVSWRSDVRETIKLLEASGHIQIVGPEGRPHKKGTFVKPDDLVSLV